MSYLENFFSLRDALVQVQKINGDYLDDNSISILSDKSISKQPMIKSAEYDAKNQIIRYTLYDDQKLELSVNDIIDTMENTKMPFSVDSTTLKFPDKILINKK